ncbi:MAG: lipoprotein signal peptidase [Bacteroidales bacterium]|nr:lipoprotein signal peptidase [Bacteroidales bacterium]
MNKQKKLSLIAGIIIVVLIILDQALKIWVKTHMLLGQNIPLLGNWLNLYFIENPGMAFGLSFGENFGKLMLTLFRIVLVIFLCWYMHKLIRKDKLDGLMLTVFSLIIAGALGNIIDCLFYGIIFNESTPFALASLFPESGGYAPFLYGRVVDMIYVKLFPIPEGFPLWGGSYFFPAIFNVADSCITVGVFMTLIFSKRILKDFEKDEKNCSETEETASNAH